MVDRLLKFRDSFSEKSKMFIYILTACLVFLTSCFLPLAFRGDNFISDDFDTGKRAAMFVKYQSGDKTIREKVNNKPNSADIKFCQDIFDEIIGYGILDEAPRKTVTEGYSFVNISTGETSMRLCRMWLQDKGDWNNWIDVYIDVDTGFVYYLYISSICENSKNYHSAVEGELNAKSVASTIAKETGYDLKIVNWSGKAEDTAAAYMASNGEALIWNINCSYYDATMLDIKISVA